MLSIVGLLLGITIVATGTDKGMLAGKGHVIPASRLRGLESHCS